MCIRDSVSRIYDELKIPCQPIAINSGHTWPKHGSKRNNQVLTISILKPVEAGLDKEYFLKILQKAIYSELDYLN